MVFDDFEKYSQITEYSCGFSLCQCGIGRKVLSKRSTERFLPNRVVLTWFLKGDGVFRQGDDEYRLGSHTVCLRRADQPYMMELSDDEGPRLFLSMHIELFRFLCLLVPELDSLAPVWEYPFSQAAFDAFMAFCERIRQSSSEDFYQLIPELVRYLLLVTNIQSRRGRTPLENGRKFLEENYSLSLEEIAEKCGMTYHTFRRLFTAEYGISPGKYRIRKRIEKAAHYIRQGVSVSDTAELLGYPDIYTFCHQFRTVKGVSPGKYAAEHAEAG